MHSTYLVPELALVRVLTAGGPYRMGDELSLAFTTPTVARLVAHDHAVRAGCVPLAEAVVPEMISALVIHAAAPYVSGEVLTLSFVDPRIARLRPGAQTPTGTVEATLVGTAGKVETACRDEVAAGGTVIAAGTVVAAGTVIAAGTVVAADTVRAAGTDERLRPASGSLDLDAVQSTTVLENEAMTQAAGSPMREADEALRPDDHGKLGRAGRAASGAWSERRAPAIERRASLLGRAASAKSPAAERPSLGAERAAAASESRVGASDWETIGSEDPMQANQDPMRSNERPESVSERPAFPSERASLAAEGQMPAPEHSSHGTEVLVASIEHPPAGSGRATVSRDLPATTTERCASTIRSPAAPIRRTEASTQQNRPIEPQLASLGSDVGVSVLLQWNPDRVRRFVQVVDKLFTIDRLGWYRHCLAMRLLIPDEIRCGDTRASVEAMRHLQALRIAAVESLGKPLLAACMPGFSITSEWLESLENPREARAVSGLREALLPYASDEVPALAQPIQPDSTVGTVFRRQLLAESAVSVEAFLPLLIPPAAHDPALAERIADYRRLLIDLFAQTARAAEPVRLNQMAQPNHSLDDRLWQLVGAVGGAFDGFEPA